MITAFGAEFDVGPGYLNSPSVGVPPRHVVEAVRTWVDDWAAGGISAPAMDEPVDLSRAAFAALTGVPTTSVAVGSVVSGLLAPVAASFRPGTRVLTAAQEFTSVSFPFAAAGHEVTEAPVAEVAERADDHDVVAVSVAQSADGALVDLEGLRTTGAVVVLDATQSLGWLPVDLTWADVVVAGGYKWLLSPRGCAWGAFSERALERVTPSAAGWYAGEDRWSSVYGLPLRLAGSARRLDVSPAWMSFTGAAVALPWLAGLDRAAVHAHDVGLARRVRTELGLPETGSAIVSIPGDPQRLLDAGVRCAARAGATRVGFHLHNTDADVDLVLDALT
ncbi:aminotransferase class V-fold PLP-dependent enzyme [Actinomycetospora sp. OC33-EN08]|uniref:Aminotransferase class V-fold PLP-dependent enzyme n=1 Tax=Actinomycetospora aurantiaca TaxID=3129233 RepID=A0ABU8MPM3_9PSEU